MWGQEALIERMGIDPALLTWVPFKTITRGGNDYQWEIAEYEIKGEKNFWIRMPYVLGTSDLEIIGVVQVGHKYFNTVKDLKSHLNFYAISVIAGHVVKDVGPTLAFVHMTAVSQLSNAPAVAPASRSGRIAAQSGSGPIHYSQEFVSRNFTPPAESPFKYAGMSIDEVAQGLRAGTISPNEIPVRYIIDRGVRIAVDNRSLLALRRAGLEPTVTVNVTHNTAVRTQTLQRIVEQLGGNPSMTIRVSGMGKGASVIK